MAYKRIHSVRLTGRQDLTATTIWIEGSPALGLYPSRASGEVTLTKQGPLLSCYHQKRKKEEVDGESHRPARRHIDGNTGATDLERLRPIEGMNPVKMLAVPPRLRK